MLGRQQERIANPPLGGGTLDSVDARLLVVGPIRQQPVAYEGGCQALRESREFKAGEMLQ